MLTTSKLNWVVYVISSRLHTEVAIPYTKTFELWWHLHERDCLDNWTNLEKWNSSQTLSGILNKVSPLGLMLLHQQQLSLLGHPFLLRNMHTVNKKNKEEKMEGSVINA